MKDVAGADHDEWNIRQVNLVFAALPGEWDDKDSTAVVSGMVDMKPADPIEGLLIGQLIAANDAAMKLYRLGWINNAEYFNAATKYLQLADKATRTVLMLTERLDHHRGRGQQQIVVKHVTTINADQAVITESIVSGKFPRETPQLAAGADGTTQIIEPNQKEAAREGGWCEIKMITNPMQKAHDAPRCGARSKRTGQPCEAPAVRGFRVCRMHGARGGAPEGKRNGNYQHGARTKQMAELRRLINSIR
jgi:hypothetical protein